MCIKRLKKSDQEIFDKTFLAWKITLPQNKTFFRGEFVF